MTLLAMLFGCSNGPADIAPGASDHARPADTADSGAEPPSLTLADADEVLVGAPGGARDADGLFSYEVVQDNRVDTWLPGGGLGALFVVVEDAHQLNRVSDLDGDGIRDVVAVNTTGTAYRVYTSAGALLSESPADALPGTTGADYVTGRTDWTLVGRFEEAYVYEAADIGFTEPVLNITEAADVHAMEADVTGDGVDDHVFWGTQNGVYGAGNKLWVIDGTDSGKEDLDTSAYATILGGTGEPRSVLGVLSAADLDADGYLDLAVRDGGQHDDGLSVYDLHEGGDVDSGAAWARVHHVSEAEVFDFDGDGRADVVGRRAEDRSAPEAGLSVLFDLGTGSADFLTDPLWRMSAGAGAGGEFVITDVDTDGIGDIVYQSGYTAYLFRGGAERTAG